MKKLSKYTVLHEQDCRAYVFHQMSEALLEIDEELETALKTGNIQSIPSDILKTTLTKLVIYVMQIW